ncbi:MAG TPA: rRNA maturation RNase YbeY [Saprospiraceae bacterium]|nr:rRNA maturation RNase YbeY [Saprospiraceae bacterium]
MIDFPDLHDEAPEAPVSFHFEDVQFELPEQQRLSDWLQGVAETEGKAFIEVQYVFCSDEKLREMNVEYLDHDYYTDVITFPYSDDAVHGDVFISYDRVLDNAQQLQVPFEQELCRVLVHGVLHLSGYPDKTEAEEKVMRGKEDFYLKRLFG